MRATFGCTSLLCPKTAMRHYDSFAGGEFRDGRCHTARCPRRGVLAGATARLRRRRPLIECRPLLILVTLPPGCATLLPSNPVARDPVRVKPRAKSTTPSCEGHAVSGRGAACAY